jgi:hypothetical protein
VLPNVRKAAADLLGLDLKSEQRAAVKQKKP